MDKVALFIAGVFLEGWTAVNIARSIEAVAGSFELSVSGLHEAINARRVRPGLAARVEVNGKPVIDGHVDDLDLAYDSTSHETTVRGRGKTADLVDCSAASGSWKGRPLSLIAKAICEPFGIEVVGEAGAGKPFKEFTVSEGESAFETLERAARMRGVLLTSDAAGRLVITRAGTERVPVVLRRGENIVKASGQFSMRDRFSRYTVKGQSVGDDNNWATAGKKGEANDTGILRHRPLTVLAEDQGDAGDFQTRATWERNTRLGRAAQVTVTVAGWSHPDGLWAPNRRVKVYDPWLGLDDELMIAGVTFRKDEDGTLTDLELMRPGAFDVLPLSEKKSGGLFS